MNVKKLIAATAATATLAVSGLVLAGSAYATPAASPKAAPAVTSTVTKHQSLRRHVRHSIVVVSAKAIGITPKALVTELKTGTSIGHVAIVHHVDPATVVTALVDAGTQRINHAVSHGRLTTERAAVLKARLPALAQKAVNFEVKPR